MEFGVQADANTSANLLATSVAYGYRNLEQGKLFFVLPNFAFQVFQN